MDEYEDLELPVYRYQNMSPDQEDGFEIPSDHEDAQQTAKFQDLLGLEPVEDTRAVPLDELPVKGAGKTFEQLVEEQMRQERVTQATQRKVTQKREFLRKNSGGLKTKPLAAEKKPIQQDIEAEDEEYQSNSKPKQTFLKRGEGKICAKPPAVLEPPPVPRPAAKTSTPAKAVPKPSTTPLPAKPVPVQVKPDTKKAPLSLSRPPPTEDEIEICREELVLPDTAIKPRLKEKPSLPPSQEPILSGIQAKMQELVTSLEKIKAENRAETTKLAEKERLLTSISEEFEEFQNYKEMRKSEVLRWKEEEVRKIKAERKALDAKTPILPKKEYEELDELRKAVSALQEELSAKENKRKSALDVLKSKVTAINTDNRMLEAELKELERRRVNEGWTRRKEGKSRLRPYSQA